MTIDTITNLSPRGHHRRLASLACLASAAMLLAGCEAINDPAYSGMRGGANLPPPPQQVDLAQARQQPNAASITGSSSGARAPQPVPAPAQQSASGQGDGDIPPAPYRTTPEYESPYPDYWRETQREDGRRDTLARVDDPQPPGVSAPMSASREMDAKVENDIYVGDGSLPPPDPVSEPLRAQRDAADATPPTISEPSALPTRAPRPEEAAQTASPQPVPARIVGQAATASDQSASTMRQAAAQPEKAPSVSEDGWTTDDEWTPPPPQVPVEPSRDQVPAPMTTAAASSSMAPVPERVTGTAYGLHLASYRRRDNAYSGWDVLTGAHPDILAGFRPRLASADLPGLGLYYRLKAGPVADRDEAIALCRQIEARGDYCAVMAFDGESF